MKRVLPALAWLSLFGTSLVLAQIPQPQPRAQVPADAEGVEVLARGPIHEAYATTAETPVAGEIFAKQPPDPVEELPPDQKPAGDNVQWIPGYWHFDEEKADFIWISGFWRQPPPGRVWVPGTWRQARGGFQWVQGFWSLANPSQPEQPAQLEYVPPPPAPLELAPSIPAPSETCFYTPGVWQWRVNRFAWRPGFWVEHRPNWMWVPAHYRWTPAGYLFVDGYWDYPLQTRGVLFAPVAFRPAVLVQPRFVYTPAYVVTDNCLYGSMFVRRGWGCYYFGDYFEQRYVQAGFNSWCGVSLRVGNFALNVGAARPAPFYDPLWNYYSVAHRHDPRWQAQVAGIHHGRFNGELARPPRTLVQQNTLVKNVTNVTNITNVINNTNVTNNTINTVVNNNSNNVMLTKLSDVRPAAQAPALQAVSVADRTKEQAAARELRQVANQRQKLESSLVDRGRVVAKPTDTPQSVKLDLPKGVVARAQFNEKNAPPDAPKPAGTKPDPKTIPPANPLQPGAIPQSNPNMPSLHGRPAFAPKPGQEPQPQVQPTIQPQALPGATSRPNSQSSPAGPGPKLAPVPQPQLQPGPGVSQPLPRPQPLPLPVAPKLQPPPPAPQQQLRTNPVPQPQLPVALTAGPKPQPLSRPGPQLSPPAAVPKPQPQPPKPQTQAQPPIVQPPTSKPQAQVLPPAPRPQPQPPAFQPKPQLPANPNPSPVVQPKPQPSAPPMSGQPSKPGRPGQPKPKPGEPDKKN